MRSGSPPAGVTMPVEGRVARLSLTDEDAPPAAMHAATAAAAAAAASSAAAQAMAKEAELEARLPPTYRSINRLCRNLCCCCYSCLPSWRPLFVSFEYVPAGRKLWWVWLGASQLYSLSFSRAELVAQLILWSFCSLTLLSLLWSAGSRGFHRGLALWQLIVWIPLELYLVFRLSGIDQEDASDPNLRSNPRLWVYAIVESVTLGLSCMLSVGDMVVWLRGKRRVFGHAHIPGASGDEPLSGENSIGDDSSYVSVDFNSLRPSPSYYGRLSDPHSGGGGGMGLSAGNGSGVLSVSIDPASSPSDAALLGAGDSVDWTPQTRSEHLLRRAEREQRMLQQHRLAAHTNGAAHRPMMPQQQQQQPPPPHIYQPPMPRGHF